MFPASSIAEPRSKRKSVSSGVEIALLGGDQSQVVDRRGVFSVFGEHGFEGCLRGIQFPFAVCDDALVEGDLAFHRGLCVLGKGRHRERECGVDPNAPNELTR